MSHPDQHHHQQPQQQQQHRHSQKQPQSLQQQSSNSSGGGGGSTRKLHKLQHGAAAAKPHHHASTASTSSAEQTTVRSGRHERDQHRGTSHNQRPHAGDEAATAASAGEDCVVNQPLKGGSNRNSVEQLKAELDREKQHRAQAHRDYADLKRRLDECAASFARAREQPVSKYDQQIAKQSYFNEQLSHQIAESKAKLKEMSASLKHIQACGKECDVHTRDLVVDYHCISKTHPHHHHGHHHPHPHARTLPHLLRRRRRSLDSLCDAPKAEQPPKQETEDQRFDGLTVPSGASKQPDEPDADEENSGELSKEIRRFQRMQIDLKSNLDRLQWRLDCESKIYHSVNDQYQKLQMDLYYLKNLNDKGGREHWMG